MKKATLADFKSRFDEFLAVSSKEPVIVMRDGKPVAMLIGVHDEDEVERWAFASSRRLQEILEAGRQEIREGRGIPSEEFWQQVETEQAARRKRAVRTRKKRSLLEAKPL